MTSEELRRARQGRKANKKMIRVWMLRWSLPSIIFWFMFYFFLIPALYFGDFNLEGFALILLFGPMIIFLLVLVVFLAGCGETINGICKDTKRIGVGVHTVFVREGS